MMDKWGFLIGWSSGFAIGTLFMIMIDLICKDK
jgi:hypothetical protein